MTPMGPLDADAIERALEALPGWSRDGDAIVRVVRRANFRDAVALIAAIADEAERANHHPDLCLRRYRTVEIRLSTHSEGGITKRDIALARSIEVLIGS
jgi:4a-hydroxytetrahydrobiopterin dehydratase